MKFIYISIFKPEHIFLDDMQIEYTNFYSQQESSAVVLSDIEF